MQDKSNWKKYASYQKKVEMHSEITGIAWASVSFELFA